jgi:hypothetical protein
MDRWKRYGKVEATIVAGGGFFALKGVLQDANPRRMTVWQHEERSSVLPYGALDQRTMFTSERIAIESRRHAGAERFAPRATSVSSSRPRSRRIESMLPISSVIELKIHASHREAPDYFAVTGRAFA